MNNVKNGRIDSINGLKGVLCLVILIHHCCDNVWPVLADYGYLAVDAFVCMSGFLMAYNYKSRINQMSFVNFFKRRYFKIMPLYWITAICMYIWVLLIYIKNSELIFEKNFAHIFFEFSGFYYGWFSKTVLPANYPAWTICVLLICYIIYYLICKIGRDDESRYILLLIGTLVVSINLNQYLLANGGALIFNESVYRCITSFVVGAFIYEIWRMINRNILKVAVILGNVTAILVIILLMIYRTPNVIGDNMLCLMIAVFFAPIMIMTALCFKPIERILSSKPLSFLGDISMSIYLWQGIVCTVFCSDMFGIVDTYKFIIVVITATLFIAVFSHYILEPRVNKMVERLVYCGNK